MKGMINMKDIEVRKLLKAMQLNAYIVHTSDYHQSEYISDYFKEREYLSGFTGSAGTLVITEAESALWVDGRYFIQAQNQLEGSQIKRMCIGQPEVPTICEYLNDHFNENATIGFNGKMVSTREYLDYSKKLKAKVNPLIDLVSPIWENRPDLPESMLYEISEYYSGESRESKIARVRKAMKEHNASYHIIAALEDQAWLFNLRADDVCHTPVFLAFTVITENDTYLFIDNEKINNNVAKLLDEAHVKVLAYTKIYSFLEDIHDEKILIDDAKINAAIYMAIKDKNELIIDTNPTTLFKAIKNKAEIRNSKQAHIYDGVAVTKLMYELKKNNKKNMSELSVSDQLEKLRRKCESFIDISFNTICAYKENAAMMHYSASEKTNKVLENNGMLLIDSGGHYLEGTTDITRTFSLGNPTEEEKKYFTTVLASMIDLADTIFLKGVTGQNLDIRAREPIWKLLIDYKCGTGHGVGHILSVHEGPNNIRYTYSKGSATPIVPGMITTDEPGIYLENKLGIRIENELLCVPITENQWGTFYGFETITYCPIDLDLVEPELLTVAQKNWLNNYHKIVFEKLKTHLNAIQVSWLKKYTRSI